MTSMPPLPPSGHRIGEPQSLDVALVDARERREALAVVAAMVHQPVLRLLSGLRSRCAVTSAAEAGTAAAKHAARQQRDAD